MKKFLTQYFKQAKKHKPKMDLELVPALFGVRE
jgi:hypothetical protein